MLAVALVILVFAMAILVPVCVAFQDHAAADLMLTASSQSG